MTLKKAAIFSLATFFSFSFASQSSAASFISQKLKEEKPKIDAQIKSFVWRKHEGTPLPEYEKLTYTISYKFINVGEATMELRGFDDINGRRAHHIYSTAKTKPFFDEVYKVRDVNEAWLDEESKISLQFIQDVDEGGYKKKEALYFYQPLQKYTRIKNNDESVGDTPSYVHDVMTALYYMRTIEMKPGMEYSVDAHSGDKSWPLKVKVIKEETIKTSIGKFNCILVEPAIREDAGIFRAKGQMQVWITNDERKIPVQLKVSVPIAGAATATLAKIEER